jgi:hypothetical protein
MALSVIIDPYSGKANGETIQNVDMKKMGVWSCYI